MMRSAATGRDLVTRREVVLQRFVVDRPDAHRPLYWQAEAASPQGQARIDKQPGGRLLVHGGSVLSFETYFNAFFEATWRQHTTLGALRLRVEAEGSYQLRVFRRVFGERVLVAEQACAAAVCEVHLADTASNFRQHGVLSLEMTPLHGPVIWRSATWVADTIAPHVGLALIICTFNREAPLTRLLRAVAADTEALQRVSRIFVVNQGRPNLAATPDIAKLVLQTGGKLQVIEQANYGGAGGFGRGLLAALEEPGLTHALLLDDDIEIEPDTVLRAASFFELARTDLVLGGQMLDGAQPTRLFEAGAVISERHWAFQPQHMACDLTKPKNLEALNWPRAIHYNGWWCCGLPLALVRQVGLPLPCFIRGDDVEYGLRLHQQGVPTISPPGIAVWHDPFYLKLGGWQIYYETRNMLVTHALHQPFDRWPVTRRMVRHLFVHLLTFRYYSAALILRAIADFLHGPSLLHEAPQALHAELDRYREQYPALTSPRGRVLYEQPPAMRPLPRRRLGYLVLIVRLLLTQFFRPTREAPTRLIGVERFAWPMMQDVEHVAVDTGWDYDLPVFRRSREDFRTLFPEGVRVIWRLFRQGPETGQAWRDALPQLASVEFWRSYLRLPPRQADAAQSSADIAA